MTYTLRCRSRFETGNGLGLGLKLHFTVWVSDLQRILMQLFQHVVRERVDAIFDLVPLDEALRWSLFRSSRKAAGQRAAAGWRGWARAAGKLWGRGRRQVRVSLYPEMLEQVRDRECMRP